MSLAFGRAMTTSIELDGQSSFLAIEVEEVLPDGVLTSEFIAAEPAVAHPAPDESFSPGCHLPQRPRTVHPWHARLIPHCRQEERDLALVLSPAYILHCHKCRTPLTLPSPRGEGFSIGCCCFKSSILGSSKG